jgi:prolipoprotein diacylglyceryltransferase/protein-S-isoprenylcysteine O-methyltransferase Ste14
VRTEALPAWPASGVGLRRLGVVVVYVLVFAVAVPCEVWALGTRLDALLHLPTIEMLRAPGRVLLAAGAALWLWAHIWFSAAGRGLPISSMPPKRLVASGPYAWFRHPIYLGFTLASCGLGCAVGSLGHGFLAPLILGTACWTYVVSFEGPALRRRYGDAYRQVGRQKLGRQLWSGIWTRCQANVERIANRTVLFRLGPTLWVTYGLFMAIGAFLVAFFGRLALGGLCSPQQYVGYAVGLPLTMAIGARLASLAYNFAAVRRRGIAELRTVGFVSWGSYLGMAVFTVAFGVSTGIPPLEILDRLMPLLFLCMALGRVGCLTYGCCFGRPSPSGVCWTDPDSKVVRLLGAELGCLPRAPVQLLGAVVGLLAAGLAFELDLWKGAVGSPTLFSVFWYCVARLGVEQFREEPRWGALEWTRGQWLAAGSAGVSLVLLMSLHPSVPMPVAHGSLDLLALGTAVTVGGLVFAIFGLHWRRVGSW